MAASLRLAILSFEQAAAMLRRLGGEDEPSRPLLRALCSPHTRCTPAC